MLRIIILYTTCLAYASKLIIIIPYSLEYVALEIDGPKMKVGTYTNKPFVYITHIYVNHRPGIIKRGVGTYTEMGAYSKEYGSINVLHGLLLLKSE